MILFVGLRSLELSIPAQINFANPVAYTIGNGPDRAIAKDVNGDGIVDLICRNSGNFTFSILTNTGAGTFVAAPASWIDGGLREIEPADIDGNHQVDLVCTSYYDTGDISLLTNDGSGGFQLSSKLHLPYPPDATHAADMNGDGLTDLIRVGQMPIVVYTNNAEGSIPFNVPFAVATGQWNLGEASMQIANDVNGDGNVDVVIVRGYENTISVVTNDGHGGLTLASSVLVGASPFTCTAADINGDGKMDIITADSYEDMLTVLTNGGSAGLITACRVATGPYPFTVATADFDGDGKLELICANAATNTISIFTNGPGSVFVQARSVLLDLAHASGITTADVNGDGRMDIVVTDGSSNQLRVLMNTTPFSPPTSRPRLQIMYQSNRVTIHWPAASSGWSLQQSSGISASSWLPAGYGAQEIVADGTNLSLTLPRQTSQLFFRLIHP